MANLIDLIIPPVHAQTTDAISQPTFGEILAGTNSTTTSKITLNADKTSVKIGDTFKVKVRIETNNLKINEYKVVVKFDSSKLSVIDQDTTTIGNQVKVLDNIFTPTDPSTDNLVSGDTITVDAKAPTGSEYQVNGDVIEIQFQAQNQGTSTLRIGQGIDGSRLTKLNGQSVAFTVSEVPIEIKSLTGAGVTTPVSTAVVTTTTTGTSTIPNTAIGDNPGLLGTLIIGMVLIITGITLTSGKNKKRTPKS